MAGIYIHIPYCKQACHYCDFHFSTQVKTAAEMGKAILHELNLRAEFLEGQPINTIYFGGGTPSLLPGVYIESILSLIKRSFFLPEHVEITLEANPDDLTEDKLKFYHEIGINRLSIGVQSFDDNVLRILNRAHNKNQAIKCIEDARKIGFRNLNVDLIYAIPDAGPDRWQKDLDITLDIFPEHVSSYGLTIEPGTVFGQWQKKGKLIAVEDELAAREYEMLISHMHRAGFDHYEISNFALPGHRSGHNTNYWLGEHYLGIGPGAHSYDGEIRQHNIPNNNKYIQALMNNEIPAIRERLSFVDQANEYMLTSLRTSWGVDLDILKNKFKLNLVEMHGPYLNRLVEGGLLEQRENNLILTDKGKLLADQITEDLFLSSP